MSRTGIVYNLRVLLRFAKIYKPILICKTFAHSKQIIERFDYNVTITTPLGTTCVDILSKNVSHCYKLDTIYVGFRENQCLVIIKQDEYYLPRDWRRFSNRYPELEGKFPSIKISVVALWNWLCKLWKEEND